MESSTAVMNLAPAPASQTPQTPETQISPEVELHEPAVLHNPIDATAPSAPAETPAGLKEQVKPLLKIEKFIT